MLIRRLALVCVLAMAFPPATRTAPRVLFVRCGTLIVDASSDPLKNAAIIVVDGKITGVGLGLTAPPGAEQLDLSAYTVLPGLIDAHSHLYTGPRGEQPSVPLATLRASLRMPQLLNAGVVAIRTLGSDDFIDVGLSAAIEEGALRGPHIVPAGHPISTPGGHADHFTLPPARLMEDYYRPLNGFINSPADAEQAVHLQLKYGARVIKIHASGGVGSPLDSPSVEQLSPEEMRVVVEQAHMANVRVAAHAESRKAILDALHAGVDSIEHGSDLTPEAIDYMKSHATYLVPTVHIFERLLEIADSHEKTDYQDYVLRKGKELAPTHLASFQAAVAAGVTIAAGTDGPSDPTALPAELVAMTRYGFSARQSLLSSTRSGAALLGLEKTLGALRVGMEGTFIATEGNPLSDITAVQRVRAVVSRGETIRYPEAKAATPH